MHGWAAHLPHHICGLAQRVRAAEAAHNPLALSALESQPPLPCGPRGLLRSPASKRTLAPVVCRAAAASLTMVWCRRAGCEGCRCKLTVTIATPFGGSPKLGGFLGDGFGVFCLPVWGPSCPTSYDVCGVVYHKGRGGGGFTSFPFQAWR